MQTISKRILILASLTLLSQICHAGGDAPVVPKAQWIDVTENGIVNQPTESKHEEKHGRILSSDYEFTASRSILITLQNKTSKKLTNPITYFDQGRLFKPLPAEILPNQIGTFYVEKKFGLFGVKGVICYRLDNSSDLVVFFENPFFGPNWYGADIYENISRNPEDIYKAITKTPANVPVTISKPLYDLYYLGLSGERTSMQVILTGKGAAALPLISRNLADDSYTAFVKVPNQKIFVSSHGTCLYVKSGGVVKMRAHDDQCEKWTFYQFADNEFALQSSTGNFLRANADERVDLASEIGFSEIWTREFLNGKIFWRSAFDSFLRADRNETVVLSYEVTSLEAWEIFDN